MPIRFPDQFPSLREVEGLSDTAFRLHVTAFFWCSINGTDGLIRREDLDLVCARVRASERFAAECERREAWHDARKNCGSPHCLGAVDEDGWVIHDFLKDNPSRAETEAAESGKSQGGKRGNHERWHVKKGKRSPGCEFCEALPEAPERKPKAPAKRTSHNRSHTDRISDSGATPIDQDLDLDFDQSSRVGQSRSDARASDADDPVIVAAVASAICAEVAFLPNDDQSRAVVATYEERARKAGTVIGDKVAYYAASVARAAKEGKLAPLLLLPAPAGAPEPAAPVLGPPGPEPRAWDPRYHEFSPTVRGAVCRCGSTENSPKHYRKQTGTDG